LFWFIAASGLREMITATALLLVIGIALLMTFVDLSLALGTYLAGVGVVLATNGYQHELESNIEPFKGLLIGLFFITVGAGADFAVLADQWLQVIGLTFATMGIKALVFLMLAVVFRLQGIDRWLLLILKAMHCWRLLWREYSQIIRFCE